MAGIYKPSNDILISSKKESKRYKFLRDLTYSSCGATYGNWAGAFNGTPYGLYMYDDLIVEFLEEVNIYGISAGDYSSFYSYCNIYDYDNNSLNDKYKVYNNDLRNQWKLMFKQVPPGRYRFRSDLSYDNRNSLISELFFESSYKPVLISMNGKYYSIKESNYNSETKLFNAVDNIDDDYFNNNCFYESDMFKELVINGETFKPIDKFDNFKFISNKSFDTVISGIKYDKEMVISAQNLSLLSAEKINAFKQIISKENNGNCKTVFSLDNGTTWKSYDVSTSQFIDLTNTLPLDLVVTTKPDNLSEENKTKWNNLQNEIVEKGVDANTMQTLDFATLLGSTYKNIRFAHVLIRPTYDDKVTLQNMSWNIDEDGDYVQTNDVEIAVNSNRLTATSTKENLQNVKVNLLI